MMPNNIQTPLPKLSIQINAEHSKATQLAGEAIQHAMRCGKLLLQAKQQVSHGQWLTWLKENCSVGERQAQRYMKVADNQDHLPSKNDSKSDLTIEQAARLIETPDDESQIDCLVDQLQCDRKYVTINTDASHLFEIRPSMKHLGYFYCTWWNLEESWVEEFRRPAARWGLKHFLGRLCQWNPIDWELFDNGGSWLEKDLEAEELKL